MKAEEIRRKKKVNKGISLCDYATFSNLINSKKNTANEWKIQINTGVNFISSKDTEEIRTFYVHSDIEEIRSGNEKVEIITKLIKSFPSNYQKEEKILKKKK